MSDKFLQDELKAFSVQYSGGAPDPIPRVAKMPPSNAPRSGRIELTLTQFSTSTESSSSEEDEPIATQAPVQSRTPYLDRLQKMGMTWGI